MLCGRQSMVTVTLVGRHVGCAVKLICKEGKMSLPNFRQLLRVAAFTMLLGLLAALLSQPVRASRDPGTTGNKASLSAIQPHDAAKDAYRNDLSAAPIEARRGLADTRTSPLDVWVVDDGSAESAIGWGNTAE